MDIHVNNAALDVCIDNASMETSVDIDTVFINWKKKVLYFYGIIILIINFTLDSD